MTTTDPRPPDSYGYAVCKCPALCCSPDRIADVCPTAEWVPAGPTPEARPCALEDMPSGPVLEQGLGDPNSDSSEDRPGWIARALGRGTRTWKTHRPRITNGLRYARHQVWLWLKMAVKLVLIYSWRGAGRLIAMASRWTYDYDSAKVRSTHAGKVETKEYATAHAIRKANLRARILVLSALGLPPLFLALAWTFPTALAWISAVVLFLWIVKLIPGKHPGEFVVAAGLSAVVGWNLPAYLVLIPCPPWQAFAVTAFLAVLGLGVLGRPKAHPILKTTVMPENVVPPLRAPMVIEALCELGNPKMNAKSEESHRTAIKLLMDPARHGPGYQVDLELPPGVTATFVQSKREEFAAALRRELGTVWPAVGRRHPGHLSLYVCDQAMSDADQDEWPLLRAGTVNLEAPFPAFTNQRNEWQQIRLAFAGMVIGAIPRMGKTFVLRQMLLAAGLDVVAKVYAFDGKGTGDLGACGLYAHRYICGARTDKPEQIEKVRAVFRELRAEMGRRADIIEALPRAECPENKVTADLIRRRPDLDLGWIVVGVDETQAFFEYGDDSNKEHKVIREELTAAATELVKLGPATGIIFIGATQQVTAKTMPSSIAANAALRFCLKIEGGDANNRILGTGAAARGVDAQMFDMEDKGIGYLKAEGMPRGQIVRSVRGLDGPAAERVAMRARAMREAKGLLTGDAAGEAWQAEEDQVRLIDELRAVFTDHDRLSLQQIGAALAERNPGLYGSLAADPADEAAVTAANTATGALLRSVGIEPMTVVTGSGRAKGVKRDQVLAAHATETSPGDDEGDDAA